MGPQMTEEKDWPSEVSSWSDDKLQAMAWKASAGRLQVGLQKIFSPLIAKEFERRGLEPVHSYFKKECCVCFRVALFRVGDNGYCKKHRGLATLHRKVALIDYMKRTKHRRKRQ